MAANKAACEEEIVCVKAACSMEVEQALAETQTLKGEWEEEKKKTKECETHFHSKIKECVQQVTPSSYVIGSGARYTPRGRRSGSRCGWQSLRLVCDCVTVRMRQDCD